MRKSIRPVIEAFLGKRTAKVSNTRTDGENLYLFENLIAYWKGGRLHISSAGWRTVTTKDRLNGLPGVFICQKKGTWYLNGKEWGGGWITITTNFQHYTESIKCTIK